MNQSNTQQILRNTIIAFEKLDDEKAQLTDQQKLLMAEAKAAGFDTKAIRRVLALRKMDQAKREDHIALVDLYMANMKGEEPFA